MEWVKLSAVPAYYHDGALLRAGEAAEVLFCRALAHCGSVESRGMVEKTVLPLLVPSKPQARADALVREGLWLDEGTHYRIRSWEKWQDEHDAAAERKARDRERKRRKRAEARSADSPPPMSPGQSADVPPDTSVRGAESPALDREGDRDREKTGRTRKRATPTPDLFPLTDELRAWGREHCPHVADPVAETQQFLDYHRGKGSSQKDWTATWRTWMRNAEKFAVQRGARLPSEDDGDEPWWMRRGGASA